MYKYFKIYLHDMYIVGKKVRDEIMLKYIFKKNFENYVLYIVSYKTITVNCIV